MEAIIQLLKRTDVLIERELNELVDRHPDDVEIADNIRISLASQSSSLKLMIEKGCYEDQININSDNRLLFTGNTVVCAIVGAIKNKTAKFSISWNEKHCLNTVASSPLSNKTKENTVLLGLVALLNQINVLKLRKVIVATTHPSAAKAYESLEYLHSMGIADDNREEIKDAALLKMLHELKSKNIKIEFKVQQANDSPPWGPFEKVLSSAKKQLGEAMK